MADAAQPGSGQGFTLLEMAIALAVCAILVALSVPTLSERMARERLAGVAHELTADLMLARQEAARRGRTVHVVFRGGDAWCWGVSLAEAADCRDTPAHDPLLLKAVDGANHPGVQLLDAAPFALDRRGTPPAETPGATVGRADFGDRYREQLRVQLTPLGRPGVCVLSGRLPGLAACPATADGGH